MLFTDLASAANGFRWLREREAWLVDPRHNALKDLAQLIGRYLRIRQEFADVFAVGPFQRDRARRLVADLRDTRKALAEEKSRDEQSGDSLTFASSAFLLPPSDFGEGDEWLGTI